MNIVPLSSPKRKYIIMDKLKIISLSPPNNSKRMFEVYSSGKRISKGNTEMQREIT